MQTVPQNSLPPPYTHPSFPDARSPMSAVSTGMLAGGAPQQMVEGPFYNGRRGDYEFSLVLDQQPIRARMCGFGDKDRRPITPPPCVRLVVRNVVTGEEVPADSINTSFFFLTVDLWDESAQQEKNIVRSSSNSPAVSISTATTTSFPVPQERTPMYATQQGLAIYQHGYPIGGGPQYTQQNVYQQSQPQQIYSPAQASYYPGSGYHQPYTSQSQPSSPAYAQQPFQSPSVPFSPLAPSGSGSNGMFTRNLIGSLAVSSFGLSDLEGKKGHWFILQDLSVRTEGTFRLRISFIDVGKPENPSGDEENKLNTTKSPVLAWAFSQPFQVFSAKKFPGVIESTPLSKCFAGQGIKIPIRKDGQKGDKDDEADD